MPSVVLEVRKLTKRFGGLTAVTGLDFDVFEGEILGVIGPNGAGKSTTFNLIAGAFPATGGEVRFAGEPILGLPPHKIAARGVMRTFQHNRPFPGMSSTDMQSLARQMNLSETTFVLPSERATAHVRIFTPGFEMPFAA